MFSHSVFDCIQIARFVSRLYCVFHFLIKNDLDKQSSLLRHFFRTLKFLIKLVGVKSRASLKEKS